MRHRIVWIFVGAISAVVVAVAAINYFQVDRVVQNVLAIDPRNDGVQLWAYYSNGIDPDDIVLDLRDVGDRNSEADVTRVLFNCAAAMKNRQFEHVYLAYRGQKRFLIEGAYFREVGEEFATQNPIYLIRTLPEHLFRMDGQQAFGTWTGGLFGVLGKQMEDFNEFHKEWYLLDLALDKKTAP